jgi:hypothetical protein
MRLAKRVFFPYPYPNQDLLHYYPIKDFDKILKLKGIRYVIGLILKRPRAVTVSF